MHICFDARMSRSWDAGTGRMTISLLDQLSELDHKNDYTVLLHPAAPEIPLKRRSRFRFVVSSIPPASATQLIRLPLWLRENRIDLIFHTHPLSMVIWQPYLAVSAVLDILPIHFPNYFPWGVSFYYKTIVRLGANLKDGVVAISNHSRQDIISHLRVCPEKIRVIHLAPAEHLHPIPDSDIRRARLASYGIHRPYILYHGNTRPHKNLGVLLKAYSLLLQMKGPSHELIFTGREVPGERERNFDTIRTECTRLDISQHVRFTGYIEDDDLSSIYSGASVFVFPSLYEGFGLPVLEAMVCGTPVVCSNTSSLPEVVGDAALLVPPTSPELIANAVLQLLVDPDLHKEFSTRGLAHAKKFSWERSALELIDLFNDVYCQRDD